MGGANHHFKSREQVIELLVARTASGREGALSRVRAIAEKMTPEWDADMRRKIVNLRNTNASPKTKLPKLYQLMETVAHLRAPHLACKAGCDACCRTIPVEISELEAKNISSISGREFVKLKPGRHTIQGFDKKWRNTPCPFLKEGLCSIYEYRPYSCRSLGVADIDELACDPVNTELARKGDPRAVAVSMTKMQAFDPIYQEINAGPNAAWGDIRQFFPIVDAEVSNKEIVE